MTWGEGASEASSIATRWTVVYILVYLFCCHLHQGESSGGYFYIYHVRDAFEISKQIDLISS